MSRVFLMKWYHFSVEYFEDLRNINHCEFLIMRKDEGGKYILENNLRTWSELKREKSLLALKEKGDEKTGEKTEEKTEDKEESKGEGDAVKVNGSSKDGSKLDRVLRTNLPLASPAASSPVEVRRRWGGCPNGCNHDKGFKIQQTLADLVKRDSHASEHAAPALNGTSKDCAVPAAATACPATDGHGNHEPAAQGIENPSFNGNGNTSSSSASLAARRPAAKRFQSSGSTEESSEMDGPTIDITKARDEVVSSPDGTPSFISVDDRLRAQLKSPNMPPKPLARRLGRDFGGTYSGQSSAVNTDDDSSEDEILVERIARLKVTNVLLPHHRSQTRDQSGMGRGARANRLGDAPHSSDGETDLENNMADAASSGADLERATTAEMEQAEAEDRGIQGSVY